MRFDRRSTLAPVLAASLLALPLAADEAEENKARELLDEVAQAYQGLSSYSDQGEFTLKLNIHESPFKQSEPARLTFVRPNRIDLETGSLRLVSDGETLTTVVAPLRKYQELPAPESIRVETFIDKPIGSFLFGAPIGPPSRQLLTLLVGNDPVPVLLEGSTALQREDDQEVQGQSLHVLRIDYANQPDLRLFIDPEGKLIVRTEQAIDAEALEAIAPPGSPLEDASIVWNAGTISTEPPDERIFAFAPPDRYTRVEALSAAFMDDVPAEEARPRPEHTLIGQAAPEFTVTVLDEDGETRQINKLDLAGKVVLIDFWATWCGPCMQELPEIVKLIDAYEAKGAADELTVLAVSLDSRPNDLNGVRELVETTLNERKFDLQRDPISLVALDPKNAVGQAFGVQGIPMLVLLDREGVVRKVQVGFDSKVDLVEILSNEIDKLLEANPAD